MFKYVMTEVIKSGHAAEDKAYREEAARIWRKFGIEEKVWQVQGRTGGQVFIEWGEFNSKEEVDALAAKVFADEEWKQLQVEREQAGTIVPGSQEIWMLSDG